MIRIVNMLIYLSFFLFIGFLSCLQYAIKWKRKEFGYIVGVWIPITLLIVFSSFKRVEIGVDTKHYLDFYINIAPTLNTFNSLVNVKFEFMFALMSHIFASLKIPFRLFLFAVYSIIYIPIGIIISRKSKSTFLSLFIYLGWSFFAFNLSGLRQAISISLCLLSLFVFEKKRFLIKAVAILIFVIGCLFHYSSLLFALAFVISSLNFKLKNGYLIFYIILGVILFVASPAIYQFIFSFTNLNYYIPVLKNGVGALFFLYLFIFAFIFAFNSRHRFACILDNKIGDFLDKKHLFGDNGRDFFFNEAPLSLDAQLIFIFYIGVLIYSMSAVSNSFVRLAFPFLAVSIISLPNAISMINNSRLKKITAIIVALCFVCLFFYEHAIQNDMNICPDDLLIF